MRLYGLLCLVLLAGPAHALENQLRHHPSPYLAMHGDDPVAWQDWGPAAVERAREGDRLLLVSSGYFSCHWCHVMQQESYRDAAIADLLNAHFVPVKLDRELHGALDGYLIGFLEKTQGQAGWPLNVFLTPEGYPLIGTTYLPPERFRELLQELHRLWDGKRDELRGLAQRSRLALIERDAQPVAEPLTAEALTQRWLRETLSFADMLEGGFGEESRFPMAPQLLNLLELQAEIRHPQLGEFLVLTLDKIAEQGLRDHLAGGFFRYTVDPSWEVPHFEKMLYTQALLSEVFMRAARLFGRDDYAEVARDTLDFVQREMAGPQGGFIASFSAVDGAGEEGGVYLWTLDEVRELLGPADTALAGRHWRLTGTSPFGSAYLPRRGDDAASIAATLDEDVAAVTARIDAMRAALLAARAKRVLPADDKELAGWNGLALAAFARAARMFDEPRYEAAATRVRDFLHDRLWDGTRLRLALSGGREIGAVSLADYAYVAYGMAEYARLSGEPDDRSFVIALVRTAWERYHGPGGWRMDDRPLIPGMGEVRAMQEDALPAPSALLIRVARGTGEPDLVASADAAAEQGRRAAQSDAFWYAGHLAALRAAAAE